MMKALLLSWTFASNVHLKHNEIFVQKESGRSKNGVIDYCFSCALHEVIRENIDTCIVISDDMRIRLEYNPSISRRYYHHGYHWGSHCPETSEGIQSTRDDTCELARQGIYRSNPLLSILMRKWSVLIGIGFFLTGAKNEVSFDRFSVGNFNVKNKHGSINNDSINTDNMSSSHLIWKWCYLFWKHGVGTYESYPMLHSWFLSIMTQVYISENFLKSYLLELNILELFSFFLLGVL